MASGLVDRRRRGADSSAFHRVRINARCREAGGIGHLTLCTLAALVRLLTRAECKSADASVPRKLLAWDLSHLSTFHEYTLFARAVLLFPLKPRCWLYLPSDAKKTKPLLGNKRLNSLM